MSIDTFTIEAHNLSKKIDESISEQEKEQTSTFLRQMKRHISQLCVSCSLTKTSKCVFCEDRNKEPVPLYKDYLYASNSWQSEDLKKRYITSTENSMACIFAVGTDVLYKDEKWTCLYFEGNKVLITKDNTDLVVSSHLLKEGTRLDSDLPLFNDGSWKQKRFAVHNRCAALYFEPDVDHGFQDIKSSIAIITKYKNKYKSKYDKLRERFKNSRSE